MAESVNQIANVAFMEKQLPPTSTNPLAQEGKKETGTLWDQSKDELAVRILLEEGKLNLVLRLLTKYMEFKKSGGFDEAVEATSKTFNSEKALVHDRCQIFESAMSILLKLALCHVEALQILDMPAFTTHVAFVLKTEEVDSTVHKREGQSTSVLALLASVASNFEELQEDRIMELILKSKIIDLTLAYVNKFQTKLTPGHFKSVCIFFSNVVSSDAFSTDSDVYLPSEEAKRNFYTTLTDIMATATKEAGLQKTDVQALIDLLARYGKDFS